MNLVFLGAISYGLGSIPFGLVLSRLGGAGDIRQIGSGNIGATNVLRTGRRGLAAATLLLDGLKGAAAVLLARLTIGQDLPLALAVSALAVIIGHCFPVWLRFRGGKGVATGLGGLLALCWPAGVLCCVIWLAVAKLSRISSAGALAAFAAAPVLVSFFHKAPALSPVPLTMLAITVLIFVRHKGNIARMLSGEESRIKIKPTARQTDV